MSNEKKILKDFKYKEKKEPLLLSYWGEGREVGEKEEKILKRIKNDNSIIRNMENIQAEINSIEKFINIASETMSLTKEEKISFYQEAIEKSFILKPYVEKIKENPTLTYALIKSDLEIYRYKKINGLIGGESKKIKKATRYFLVAIFTTLLAFIANAVLNSYQENSFNRNKEYDYNLGKVKYLQDISSSLYNNIKLKKPIFAAWEKFPGTLSPKILLKEPRSGVEEIIIKSLALHDYKGEKLANIAKKVSSSFITYEKCLSLKFSKEREANSSPDCTNKFNLDNVKLMAIEASKLSI